MKSEYDLTVKPDPFDTFLEATLDTNPCNDLVARQFNAERSYADVKRKGAQ